MAAPQNATSDTREGDRSSIARTLDRFCEAWNAHDAHAFSLTFTEDADFTNVVGMHAQGRANLESFHAPVFATMFKASHQASTIRSVRFLTPDLAAVDVEWRMTGSLFPDGSPRPDRQGLIDWILAKQADGSWLIAIMHNAEFNRPPGAAPSLQQK